MKKTMNKFSALLAVVFIAFAFAACSKDEENNLDQKHLLFTGCGYTPLKLYFLEKKTY